MRLHPGEFSYVAVRWCQANHSRVPEDQQAFLDARKLRLPFIQGFRACPRGSLPRLVRTIREESFSSQPRLSIRTRSEIHGTVVENLVDLQNGLCSNYLIARACEGLLVSRVMAANTALYVFCQLLNFEMALSRPQTSIAETGRLQLLSTRILKPHGSSHDLGPPKAPVP